MSAKTPYWKPWPTDKAIVAATVSWDTSAEKATHNRIVGMLKAIETILMVRERAAVREAQLAILHEAQKMLGNEPAASSVIQELIDKTLQ